VVEDISFQKYKSVLLYCYIIRCTNKYHNTNVAPSADFEKFSDVGDGGFVNSIYF